MSAIFTLLIFYDEHSHSSRRRMCCASCGIAAIDDVKLKDCDDGCGLVKYCSGGCQEYHRKQHKEECKKRLAELRDIKLFTPPDESHEGECPICCLPLPIDANKCTLMGCCCKTICNGCCYTNQVREIEAGLQPRCPFCREPAPKSEEESQKRVMKRIKECNDPAAMYQVGKERCDEGDYDTAFEYYTKAAELGDVIAHYQLSVVYRKWEGVKKDEEKAVYHWEKAAIGGNPFARYNLACYEAENGNTERAVKHWIIAANLGCEYSMKRVLPMYKDGYITKEKYGATLRAHQAAINATKSEQREEAEQIYGAFKNR